MSAPEVGGASLERTHVDRVRPDEVMKFVEPETCVWGRSGATGAHRSRWARRRVETVDDVGRQRRRHWPGGRTSQREGGAPWVRDWPARQRRFPNGRRRAIPRERPRGSSSRRQQRDFAQDLGARDASTGNHQRWRAPGASSHVRLTAWVVGEHRARANSDRLIPPNREQRPPLPPRPSATSSRECRPPARARHRNRHS